MRVIFYLLFLLLLGLCESGPAKKRNRARETTTTTTTTTSLTTTTTASSTTSLATTTSSTTSTTDGAIELNADDDDGDSGESSSSSDSSEITTLPPQNSRESATTTTEKPTRNATTLSDPFMAFNYTSIQESIDSIMRFNETIELLFDTIPEIPTLGDEQFFLPDMIVTAMDIKAKFGIALRTCYRKNGFIFVPRNQVENSQVKELLQGPYWADIKKISSATGVGNQYYTQFTGLSKFAPEIWLNETTGQYDALHYLVQSTDCIGYDPDEKEFSSKNCRTDRLRFFCGRQTNRSIVIAQTQKMYERAGNLNVSMQSTIHLVSQLSDELRFLFDQSPSIENACPYEPELIEDLSVIEHLNFDTMAENVFSFITKSENFATKLSQALITLKNYEHAIDEEGSFCVSKNEQNKVILVQDGKAIEGNSTVIYVKEKKNFLAFTLVDLILSAVSALVALISLITCTRTYCPRMLTFMSNNENQTVETEMQPMNKRGRRQVRFVSTSQSAEIQRANRSESSSSDSSDSSSNMSGAYERRYLNN